MCLCCLMYSDYQLKHQLGDFDAHPQTALPTATEGDPLAMPADIPICSIEELGIKPNSKLGRLIRDGDDKANPIGSEGATFPSRSEALISAAFQMVRSRFPLEKAAGVLLNPAYGISASVLEKPSSKKYAWRQVVRAREQIGIIWPDVTKEGFPRPTYRNAIVGLKALGIEVRLDMFRHRITANGALIQQFSGDMTDDILAVVRKLFADEHDFDVGKINTADALHTLALENAHNPMCDYFDGLEWDGTQRLKNMLPNYFGAEDTELNQHFGSMLMIAVVRRVRVPRTKFDTMLVLEGSQGTGKSTALKILAGEEAFSDQTIIGLDQKAQGELVVGVLIYEVAELSGMRHSDTAQVKSFLSRDTDRYRPAYGRYRIEIPRQCVFVGTTNDDSYLKDLTGNRRFWPIATGDIDLEALKRDRDQLWAEAAHLEARGAPIVLPKELWEAAAKLQEARIPCDPWLDMLSTVVGSRIVNGEERITTQTLLGESNLNIPANQQHDYTVKRLSRVMNALGWEGPKPFKLDGKTQRGYTRPAENGGSDDVSY